ncbi:MAG: hypothetical protein CMK64_11275 [Pseudoalteromonas sp.]|nr:hypothetical protein [Pseudoalteromonas sp.]|tara:strand:+ start:1375 stop:1854 length:480 start_codon:yes stop_codon:yes gene_type:complete
MSDLQQKTDTCVCTLFKEERKRLKLNQKVVADFLKMSTKQVSRWESNIPIPSDKLAVLVELGFDVNYVLTGKRISSSGAITTFNLDKVIEAVTYATEEAILSVYQVKKLRKELGDNGELDAVKNIDLIVRASGVLTKAELTGEMSPETIRNVFELANQG